MEQPLEHSMDPLQAQATLADELLTRAHTLGLPRSRLGRLGLRAQEMLEAGVARVSRLPDAPVYAVEDFPWAGPVVQRWREIREELDALMPDRERMPSFHQVIREVSTITQDDDWKTYFLINAGRECGDNARRCPRTMALLREIPQVATAFFSILAPGKHIPAHRGAYNGVLRFHLGLIVPEPQARCRIRVGNRIEHWREGQALIFDDSFNHEVWNDTQGHRVVLFVDFPRPLRQPWDWLNQRFLRLAPLLPTLRRAGARLKQFEAGRP